MRTRDSVLPVARSHVPNPHGPVKVGGNKMPAIRTERHTGCLVAESTQAAEYFARVDIPDFHFTLFTAGKELPIGIEGDAPEALGARKGQELLARAAVPQLHSVRNRGQSLAVGMESDAKNPAAGVNGGG